MLFRIPTAKIEFGFFKYFKVKNAKNTISNKARDSVKIVTFHKIIFGHIAKINVKIDFIILLFVISCIQ